MAGRRSLGRYIGRPRKLITYGLEGTTEIIGKVIDFPLIFCGQSSAYAFETTEGIKIPITRAGRRKVRLDKDRNLVRCIQ